MYQGFIKLISIA